MARRQNPNLPPAYSVLPHGEGFDFLGNFSSANSKRAYTEMLASENHFLGSRFVEMNMVEALAQGGAYYPMYRSQKDGKPLLPLFGAIESARFGQLPGLGQILDLKIEALPSTGLSFRGRGEAKLGKELACETVVSGLLWPEKTVIKTIGRTEFADENIDMPVQNKKLISPQELFEDEGDMRLVTGLVSADEMGARAFLVTDEKNFAGHHFGGQAVLAAIRQVLALKETAQLNLAANGEVTAPPRLTALIGNEQTPGATFTRPIRPHERLDLYVERIADTWFRGRVEVGGKVACEATLELAKAA